MSDVKKAWEEKKEKIKRSFSLKQLLRKCIAKKANERKRKQLKKTAKPTITDSTHRDDRIIVIPTPNTTHGVMVDEQSSPPSPSSHSSAASDDRESQSGNSFTGEQNEDQQYCAHWVDDPEDIECIELTDEQPTHTSVSRQPQELVFDNVPTLKEKLKMDKKKRKKEKKEERQKKKEAKKAAKIEMQQQIALKKRSARNSKQLLIEIKKYKKEQARAMARAVQAKVVKEKKRVRWAAQLVEYFEEQEPSEDDVKSSESEAQERQRAMIVSQMEASIVDFENKIEKMEAKNVQGQTELSSLEEKRSNITCFEAQNPSTTMEDYELQFTMQRLKKDIEISTRTISVLKSAMTKKQNIIDRMKNPSQQVTPVTAVKTSNTEPACDTTCPVEDSASLIPDHVIVVKEYCAESSSLTSLPKLVPDHGFLTATPVCIRTRP